MLFKDNREEGAEPPIRSDTGPAILKEEVRWALERMELGKSMGPDEIATEMLLALPLGEIGVDLVWKILNHISYETSEIPEDMMKSIFKALPKISNAMACENYRTISLMSRVLKVLLKIILQRIRRKLRPEIPDNQYGFMENRGTRNAIFILRIISERAIQFQQEVYVLY